MNLTFKPIKFNNPSDLFNRPDEYTLSFPNEEPMCFLKAKNGKEALIEFIHENDELKQEELIGENYQGIGIYFVPYSNEETKIDYIPFWIVLPKEMKLTVGETKSIISKINDILLSNEYELSNFWRFDK